MQIKMSSSRYALILLLWITTTNEVIVPVHGSRKMNIQFDNVTFMDIISKQAMHKMHDELDNDDDGNVSFSEGVKFIAGHKDLLENNRENANLPGFVTDVDGRITEAEFWDSWLHSDVHNWSNSEMLDWLKYEVELPQYSSNLHTLNVSGAAFPILAHNSSVVSFLVDGSKENKMKLMLKAKEIVLFGPPKQKSNFLKDVLLTFSLALALSGIAFGMHVKRNANRTILSIEEKMKALQSSMDTMEAEGELDKIWARELNSNHDDERSGGSNSGESEDSMTTISTTDEAMTNSRLAEVMRELDATREKLRNAEKQIQRRSNELPDGLLECIQSTYQVESRLFDMKKKKVYKDVEQTKVQFQKIERNRSNFFGMLQVVHSRQMDSFDFQVQQTRDEFRELQSIMKERKKRWAMIQQMCGLKVKFSARNTATSSKHTLKLSPDDDDILGDFDSVSLSTGTSSVERSLTMMQKHKGKNKRPSMPITLNGEEKDTVSLQDLNMRKSPSSPNRQKSLPTRMSSPVLSSHSESTNNKNQELKKMPHSDSTSQLNTRSHSPIPETVNATFPKRSPNLKRRSKLPDAMIKNGNKSAPNTPIESPVTPTRTKTNSDAMQLLARPGSPLTQAKRSTSSQSLQTPRTNDLDLGLLAKSTDLITKNSPNVNGNNENLVISSLNKTTPGALEKSRKGNFVKRAFFKMKKK